MEEKIPELTLTPDLTAEPELELTVQEEKSPRRRPVLTFLH